MMVCPRCEASLLDERERHGITIDVCRDCKGVWLDRGELEKLVARAVREEEEESRDRRHRDERDQDRSRDDRDQRDRDRDYRDRDRDYHNRDRDYRDRDDRYHGKRKRRSPFLEALGDLFD